MKTYSLPLPVVPRVATSIRWHQLMFGIGTVPEGPFWLVVCFGPVSLCFRRSRRESEQHALKMLESSLPDGYRVDGRSIVKVNPDGSTEPVADISISEKEEASAPAGS